MRSLTAFVLRHKLVVVVCWLALAAAGAVTIGTTTGRLTKDFSLPGQPAYTTNARIAALYHNGGSQEPTIIEVTAPPGESVSAGPGATRASTIVGAGGHAAGSLRLLDQSSTGDRSFTTADGRSTFAVVFTPAGPKAPDVTPQITAAATAEAPPGWQVGVTGIKQLQNSPGGGGTGVLTETVIGGLGALIVLALVFASFLALLPVFMAIIAIPTTFFALLGLTHLTSISFVVQFLVALIGLGVAIDYSLLVVNRWREHRARGAANTEAVTEAMGTAGRAVVFSGLTVAISLLALVVLPVPFLRSVGFAGFFIPLISIAVATTLLPVMLATIGPALDRPRHHRDITLSPTWNRWGRFVVAHAKAAGAVGGVILIALLVPLFAIRTGQPASASLAQTGPAHAALAELTTRGVPSGIITPVEVLTTDRSAGAVAARLGSLPGVHTAFAPNIPGYRHDGTAIVDVLPDTETSLSAGRATVNRIRSALRGKPNVIGVGGTGAESIDFNHAVYGTFPLMLTVIALLTFVLLARAFRSILLAAKAVICNLLSVGAAYGVMVLVWQMGHGSHALWGIPATGAITNWVPVMVFAFLFGLSMDYEVFIVSRIREEYDATRSTTQAVTAGIARTGRLVTSAALILFLAFVSLSTSPETDLKILATGLGAGIVFDAVIIRTLIVPALVTLFGRANWWLPSTLACVLRVPPSHPAASAPDAQEEVLV